MLRQRDVTVNAGAGRETVECYATIPSGKYEGQFLRMRYSGYSAREALRTFVRDFNAGRIAPLGY